MIEWVDRQYGRVIAKLEELNVRDDLVIAFLSDHGEMLGQKGLWEKQQFLLNGPSEMVKQDHLKHFRFHGRAWPEQLFDLAADPNENRNLIDDPAYAADLQRLRARLDAFR